MRTKMTIALAGLFLLSGIPVGMLAQTSTSIALNSTPNPASAGQTVMLTATVSAGSGTPTGFVVFKDEAENLSTANLTSGVATLSVLLTPGTHAITAYYGGNATFASSASTTLAQTVTPATGAEPLSVTSFAGPNGLGSRDGPASQAKLERTLRGLALDSAGNLYVADSTNNTVRKITPTGFVTTLAGLTGVRGFADLARSTARFGFTEWAAMDRSGNIYITDSFRIRKVTPGGEVTTLAGDETSGTTDGTGNAARFSDLSGIAVDSSGTVFVSDGHAIRRISPAGEVSTFAGQIGTSGSGNGTGSAARFFSPAGLAVDGSGNVYVADTINNAIRKITPAAEVTTLAGLAGTPGSVDGTGSAARFSNPQAVAVDNASNVYVADRNNHLIRKVKPTGEVTTVAGSAGLSGWVDGTGSAARLQLPNAIASDGSGNLFVSDESQGRIRRVTAAGEVSTFAGFSGSGSIDGAANAARFNSPGDIAADAAGNLFLVEGTNHIIRKITPAGAVSTLAGTAGSSGSTDETGPAARFNFPTGIAVDAAGDLYVSDASNHTIRKITAATGNVTTVAGTAGSPGIADGNGSAARFRNPRGIAIDSDGNVYVADQFNHCIRKITSNFDVSTFAGSTAGGSGAAGFAEGTGTAARFNSPIDLVIVGPDLYVTDSQNRRIRRIALATAEVTTFAGSGTSATTDGVAGSASFTSPFSITAAGTDLYVTDGQTIRRVTSGAAVWTVAGIAGVTGSTDGTGSEARLSTPQGLAFSGGNLYISEAGNHKVRRAVAAIDDRATIDQSTAATGVTRQLDTTPQTATSWQWSLLRQPADSGAAISSTTIRNPTVTPDIVDLYVFRLEAASPAGSSISTVSLTSTNPGCGLMININVSPASLPPPAFGESYTQTIFATGGTGPYNFAVASGSLPSGLTLSTTGVLSGAPSVAGSFTFVIRSTDASGCTGTRSYSLTITQATTATTLLSSVASTAYGQAVTFTAQVSSASGTPAGTVTFKDGTAQIGTATLSSGTGTLTTYSLGAGSHSITATYDGSANFPSSTSAAVIHTVSQAATTITLLSSQNPANVNDQITFTATVSSATGAPTGTVTFKDDITALGTGILSGGQATLRISTLSAGTHSITAVYSGELNFISSTSGVVTQTINGNLRVRTLFTLTSGLVGTPYMFTLSAVGGSGSYSWSVFSGTLPAGLTLSNTGVISGTPTTAGSSNFTVQVNDGATTFNAGLTLRITTSLAISAPDPLPPATVGFAYSTTITATGGTGNHTWGGSGFPTGLDLGSVAGQPNSTQRIFGTPPSSGTFTFVVTATDGSSTSVSKQLTLTINPPPLTISNSSPLPMAIAGSSYTVTFAASGGAAGYTWAIASGSSLPAGLSLAADGTLSGTPSTPGTYNFTIQVTDSAATSTNKTFSLTVNPAALAITSTSPLSSGVVGAAHSQTLTASGGVAPYSWSVALGTLPDGLSLSTAGVISGTPTTAGTSNFSIQVTDTAGASVIKAFALTVNASPLSITTNSPLPPGTVGTAYSQTFAAAGGVTPYTWLVAAGSSLPQGLTLSAGGVLSGTSTAAGTFDFTIQVTDNTAATATKAFSLTINPAPPAITTNSPLPSGAVGASYAQTLSATGGTPPYNWTVSAGALPSGLTLSSSGAITGTPTAAGTFNFTIRVTDNGAATAMKDFALTINASAPTITTNATLPPGTVGSAYSQTFAATGGTGGYTWSVGSGSALPPGLTLSNAGVLSGTPTSPGTFSFVIEVSDSSGVTTAKTFSLSIGSDLAITSTSPIPNGTVGSAYSYTFMGAGGIEPYRWQGQVANLLISASGVLSGTPNLSGTFDFTVQLSDSAGTVVTKQFQWTIDPATRRGDANGDGNLTVADVIYLLNALFGGGPAVGSTCAGDANNDGEVNIIDVFYAVNHLFVNGPAPAVCQ